MSTEVPGSLELVRLDFAKSNREYISEYIKFADSKAGAILGLVTLTTGAAGVLAPEFLNGVDSVHAGIVCAGVFTFVVGAIAAAVAIWKCVDALTPRPRAVSASLSSFPDLAKMEPDNAVRSLEQASVEGLVADRMRHAVTLSVIAVAKYDAVTSAIKAVRVLLLAVVGFVLCSAALSAVGG